MNHDPLSDVLSSVRLRGAVFYYGSFGDDWAAETPASRQLADALMPGAEHVLAYHLIARGSGWAATAGEPPVGLNSGDIVMIPDGDSHVLSSAPGLRAQPDNDEWRVTTRNDPKPIAVAYHRGVLRPGAPLPADEASTVVVCGFVGCDLRPFNPLINALPRLLHLGTGGVGASGSLRCSTRPCRNRASAGQAAPPCSNGSAKWSSSTPHGAISSLCPPMPRAGRPVCATATSARLSAYCMRGLPSRGRSTNWAGKSDCRARRCTSVLSNCSGSRRCST